VPNRTESGTDEVFALTGKIVFEIIKIKKENPEDHEKGLSLIIMKSKYLEYIAIFSFLLLLCHPFPSKAEASSGSDTLKDMLSGGTGGESVCSSVKQAVGEGLNARDVVRAAVEMGHNACLVIKCAVYSGGSLENIIDGATDAGVACDVVSRCCMDAGVRAEEVATNLVRVCDGLGYSEPPQTLTMPVFPADPPAISPHRF
jgi:hypothetical protein